MKLKFFTHCIFSLIYLFIYLFIIIFTRGKDVQGKETITNILAWAESEYKEGPSFSKSELPS